MSASFHQYFTSIKTDVKKCKMNQNNNTTTLTLLLILITYYDLYIIALHVLCSKKHVTTLLSRVSILTRDIDIANLSVRLSVRDVPVSDENGLTYRHSFFTIR